MRKVTRQVVTAFINQKSLKVGNTETDGQHLYLHGNLIAVWSDSGEIVGSLAGWNTPTTRERLNGLCELIGSNARFYQKSGEPRFRDYTGDTRIDPKAWFYLGGARNQAN